MSIAVASRLSELESVIERGLTTFVEVGTALMEIRDGRLYRTTHATFDDYCRDRWQFARAQASRLIDAATVVLLVSPIGDKPRNEAQARELVPLMRHAPDQVADAWREVQERGPATADAVREVVDQRLGREPAPTQEEPPIETSDWIALRHLMEALAAFTSNDAARIAATVPQRNRAATARRLRKLGSYLGRIAWTLEGEGVAQ